MSKEASETIITAQVELVGRPRRKKVAPYSNISLKRTPRIVIGLNETTGKMVAMSAARASTVVSDLPRLPLNETQQNIDLAEMEGSSIASVRKGITTTTGVDTQAQFEARGAKPGFKMPKRGGFSSVQEARRIAAIRQSRQSGKIT